MGYRIRRCVSHSRGSVIQAQLLDNQDGANTERCVHGKLSARWFQRRRLWRHQAWIILYTLAVYGWAPGCPRGIFPRKHTPAHHTPVRIYGVILLYVDATFVAVGRDGRTSTPNDENVIFWVLCRASVGSSASRTYSRCHGWLLVGDSFFFSNPSYQIAPKCVSAFMLHWCGGVGVVLRVHLRCY